MEFSSTVTLAYSASIIAQPSVSPIIFFRKVVVDCPPAHIQESKLSSSTFSEQIPEASSITLKQHDEHLRMVQWEITGLAFPRKIAPQRASSMMHSSIDGLEFPAISRPIFNPQEKRQPRISALHSFSIVTIDFDGSFLSVVSAWIAMFNNLQFCAQIRQNVSPSKSAGIIILQLCLPSTRLSAWQQRIMPGFDSVSCFVS
mmetsp:Transcript_44342/g.139899  ORF Transcript_44342/g.139899 Transcript_44342/m.139899 type:complete len:201 (-) Transcript_44342:411-1013(-)